jgi:SnoaL-like polyketide cyclase.
MADHNAIITKFYTAFQNKDWQTMQQCYHTNATFSDSVFQNLTAKETKAMWHMLAVAAQNFSLTFENVTSDGDRGACHWEARYLFSKTGRPVHNKIDAQFVFKDGLIVQHQDNFDLWKWCQMALGGIGMVLGWSPFLQNKVRTTARKGLKKFISDHPVYQG